MSWHQLPPELHLAIIHRLPPDAVRALASTACSVRHLCLPAIFANVTLPSPSSLLAFARHVPTHYGQYVRSLAVSFSGATGAPSPTDALFAVLGSCSRLQSLFLSLASPLDPQKAVSAFVRLKHVHSLQITSAATEDVAPLSERLVVALAASLPSLAHLSVSRVSRSAIHLDPCDVPYGVPIVTNDVDVPPHPLLKSNLALPNLLRLPSLRTLEIRDTWLGCDTKIDLDGPAACCLHKLVLTGSMYTASIQSESQACVAWLNACPSLRSFEIGTALSSLPDPSTPTPRVPHVHINASRVLPDDLASTLNVLSPYCVESISITYEEPHGVTHDAPLKIPPVDDFAHQCALDDLQDWSTAIDDFLDSHPKEEWSALARIEVSLAQDIRASWDL